MLFLLNKSSSDSPPENSLGRSEKIQGPILENKNDGILNLNLDLLRKEYCNNNFNDNSLIVFENMYNDFKIILKLIESLKAEYKNGEEPKITNGNNKPTSSLSIKLIDL